MSRKLFYLLALVTITFILLNIFSAKNYFVNDDTLSYFLPNIIVQANTLFNFRQIPFINFYQFLGHPLLPQGQSGALYLPHYLFYLLALPFKNYELIVTFEVFFNLILAAVSFYFLLKELKLKENLCLICSYAYCFNGFIIEVGRNWLITTSYMTLIPLLFLFLIRFSKEKKYSFYLLTLIRAIMFYIGYSNFFVIIVAFEILFLLITSKPNLGLIIKYLLSFIFTTVLILPVFTPIIIGLVKSNRINVANDQFNNSISILFFIKSFFFLPCKTHFSASSCQSSYYFNPLSIPTMFIIIISAILKFKFLTSKILGFVRKNASDLLLSFIIQVILSISTKNINLSNQYFDFFLISLFETMSLFVLITLIKTKGFEQRVRHGIFLFLIVSLMLSSGSDSFYSVIFQPLIAFFRWPFKWYILTQFFLTLVFGHTINVLISNRISNKASNIFTFFILLLIILISNKYTSDWIPQYDSYLSISKRYLGFLENRTIPIGIHDFNKKNLFTKDMTANISSYYHLLSYAGYDPLISRLKANFIQLNKRFSITNDSYYYKNKDKLEAYGVKTYIYDKKSLAKVSFLKKNNFIRIYEDNDNIIYKDMSAKPIVYLKNSGKNLGYKIKGNKIVVSLDQTINNDAAVFTFFKDDDNWLATVDSSKAKIVIDRLHRITVPIKYAVKEITIEYKDKYFYTGLSMTLLLLVSILTLVIILYIFANINLVAYLN